MGTKHQKTKVMTKFKLGFSVSVFVVASVFMFSEFSYSNVFSKMALVPYLGICLTSFFYIKESISFLKKEP